MIEIPLQPVPSQRLSVILAGQNVQIALYQKPQGLFADVEVNGVDVTTGVICRDKLRLARSDYVSFIGTLYFVDTQGSDDPYYSGLGARWGLVYE